MSEEINKLDYDMIRLHLHVVMVNNDDIVDILLLQDYILVDSRGFWLNHN